MRARGRPQQTEDMSSSETIPASALSAQLVRLIEESTHGVAVVKGAAYRTSSAVVIADNLIATTAHTLKREERVGIVLPGGAEATGTLAGRDPGIDVALLHVEGAKLAPLAPAAPPRVGALIAVVGFTADVGPSASLGIIGAVGGPRRTWRGGSLDQFIRLDVNVYPSQSGAAIVDIEGGLIGLATPALLRHSAVAIPYTTLKRVADEISREGRLRQGYLGVGLQPLPLPDSLREKAGVASRSALMVLSIEPESSAERSGLQLGDILLSLGGVPTEDPEDLQQVLRGDRVGQTLEALLIRGGEIVRLPVYIQERPSKRRE